jgi:hypothetical protein
MRSKVHFRNKVGLIGECTGYDCHLIKFDRGMLHDIIYLSSIYSTCLHSLNYTPFDQK